MGKLTSIKSHMSPQADAKMAVSTRSSDRSSEQGENPSVASPAGVVVKQPLDPLGEGEMIQFPANCALPDSSARDQRGQEPFDGGLDGAARGKKNKGRAPATSSSQGNQKRKAPSDDNKDDDDDSDGDTFDPQAKQTPNTDKSKFIDISFPAHAAYANSSSLSRCGRPWRSSARFFPVPCRKEHLEG